jgi:hypothetical protein
MNVCCGFGPENLVALLTWERAFPMTETVHMLLGKGAGGERKGTGLTGDRCFLMAEARICRSVDSWL